MEERAVSSIIHLLLPRFSFLPDKDTSGRDVSGPSVAQAVTVPSPSVGPGRNLPNTARSNDSGLVRSLIMMKVGQKKGQPNNCG